MKQLLTKEQRRANAERRFEERRALKDRLFKATLNCIWPAYRVRLCLEEGDINLRLSFRCDGEKEWTTHLLHPDPMELAQFIAALAARYNEQVSEMNKTSACCKMDALSTIEPQ